MAFLIHHRIFGRVHLVLTGTTDVNDDPSAPYAYFGIDDELSYDPFLDEFGPSSILALYQFSRKLDSIIQNNPHRSTALCVGQDAKAQTTAALLLGAYMVMLMDFTPNQALARLPPLDIICFGNIFFSKEANVPTSFGTILRYHKDRPTCNESVFTLCVRDCLEALRLAKRLGWADLAQGSSQNDEGYFIGFDVEDYAFLDNPLNADLHEVCSALSP